MALLRQTLQPLVNYAFHTQTAKIIFRKPGVRQLYAAATLGLDNFLSQRDRVKAQLANVAPKFKEKMTEYTADDSKNMVFTEDLKNMLHLAETNDDVTLVIKMMKRFNQQNKQLRFGNYVFGPVIMRLFYFLNKHEEAFQCFKSTELNGLFDQMMSYQILLDLLYENQRYNDILEAFEIIKSRQIEGVKFARNVVVLMFAACYKLNTQQSLEIALKLWSEINSIGHFPMRRAVTFCSGLAINQGKPEIGLEILSGAKNANYTTIRNLKVVALVDLGRIDDALAVLKSILQEDGARMGPIHTFNMDVIGKLKNAVKERNNADLSLEFDRLEKYFKDHGHISNTLLNDQLCTEIAPPQSVRNNANEFSRQQYRTPYDDSRRNPNYRRRTNGGPARPGLSEMH
ncbi:hypothetical protein PPYR_01790 [Photinus pyralis]|uniref:Pentacotripeptide-repeat region of PRORP domain-containing protein n=1 Tax=Photinus pyralis TaxID=7054 RepID=A0A1Y1NBV0_PHOPY|nr:pentatricopeptide repeat-containing protein 2, mitochondrial-like [Photinus pyralis]KAB0804820.1 hypothetical protein PPYR_01790 [Photinus pyralis]